MSLFSAVTMAPRDPILGLNEQFAADPNPHKVNLGVGVYFDDDGKLPLLQCVQSAEAALMAQPTPRGYLPIDGIPAYNAGVKTSSSARAPSPCSRAAWPRCRRWAAQAGSRSALIF